MFSEVVWGMVCRDASIEGRFQAMWARQKRGHDRAVISFLLAMFALRELRLFYSPGFAQVHSLHTQLGPGEHQASAGRATSLLLCSSCTGKALRCCARSGCPNPQLPAELKSSLI